LSSVGNAVWRLEASQSAWHLFISNRDQAARPDRTGRANY